jgi:hypothetical protein
MIQSLREAAAGREVNVGILTPINNVIQKIIQNIMVEQANNLFDIRAIETT